MTGAGAGWRAQERLDRSGYQLVLDEAFAGPDLDRGRWVDHYLPHWTTPERSAARYALGPDGLRLRVDADQPAWLPEDGGLRVSNLQTGSFSGPAGSSTGQMAHRPGLVVRTPQPTRRLWTPTAGLVEAVLRASPDPTCMLAVWLVGLAEGGPATTGEVCVVELFGDALGRTRSTARVGVKAHQDPLLREDVVDVRLPIDATEEHSYAAAWDERSTRFYVDDRLVHESRQGTAYPLQLMVDLFEFPVDERRDPARYPKEAWVRRVRGYEPAPR
ncbi:glycoside hydrolase family 16 protein [Vallicoccus soli]|uniref:Glycosyl hydrolase family protein n=1 Tax=Vallicoccus soli TaxID=2339232 RepID=A0A3A3ZLA6_9ACTN|nr:glycoside hydrolase family 16 protein [Vallicoccus soli]RJK96956.1 glycosyl hydrolase family protein [Vallicoccus soli]